LNAGTVPELNSPLFNMLEEIPNAALAKFSEFPVSANFGLFITLKNVGPELRRHRLVDGELPPQRQML
jgi:hypothetical protein